MTSMKCAFAGSGSTEVKIEKFHFEQNAVELSFSFCFPFLLFDVRIYFLREKCRHEIMVVKQINYWYGKKSFQFSARTFDAHQIDV